MPQAPQRVQSRGLPSVYFSFSNALGNNDRRALSCCAREWSQNPVMNLPASVTAAFEIFNQGGMTPYHQYIQQNREALLEACTPSAKRRLFN
jgi:hypothetical protein